MAAPSGISDVCVYNVCASDIPGGSAVVGAAGDAGDAVNTASSFAEFWTDPFGNTFRALQEAAHSLATDVLPALTHATLPDLTQQWWVSAYAVSFALSVFVMVFLLFPGLVSAARGRTSGQELFEQFTVYVPLFLAGAIFGPPLGIFLVKFFGSITDSIASWGVTASADEVTEKMTTMLADGDASGLAGGAVVGILLMLLMLLGLILVVLMLVVQLVTLYFTGILFPLGWVWIIHKPTRNFGYKIVFVWVGILASHPLMFLMLGLAYSMIAAQVGVFEGVPSLARLVTLVVSVLALLVAGTAPFTLMKFAPVMPFGNNAQGPAAPSGTVGDSDLNQTSRRNQFDSSDAGVEDSRPSSTGGDSGTAPSKGPTAGGGVTTDDPSATGAGSTGEAANGAKGGEAAETGASKVPVGAGTSGAGAGAAEGAGAAAGAGGGGAVAGMSTTEAAAGAAGAATGVGAVMVGAAIIAKAGYDYAKDTSEQAADMTAADVETFGGDNVMGER